MLSQGDMFASIRQMKTQLQAVWGEQEKVVDGLREHGTNIDQLFSRPELLRLVRTWDQRLRSSLDPKPPEVSVVTGFSATLDRVLVANRSIERAFNAWVGCSLVESKNPMSEVMTEKDVEEALKAALNAPDGNPKGLKPVVKQCSGAQTPSVKPLLVDSLRSFFTGKQSMRILLGGAAAVMADVLAQLKVTARVSTIWWPELYASKVMADTAWRVVIGPSDGVTYQRARESGEKDHPVRYSYVFQIAPGQEFLGISPANHDRFICIVRQYEDEGERKWSHAEVVDHSTSTAEDVGTEWPFVQGFVSSAVDSATGKLTIRFAGPEAIESIRDAHQYVILSGLGLGNFPNRSAVQRQELRRQLKGLAARCTLHLEISGGAKPKNSIELFAKEVQECGIRSLSINDEELAQITSVADFKVQVNSSRSATYVLYKRALALANRLNLDRLYVHTNTADLILRRGAGPQDMTREIDADLFAKGAVVVALLQRSFSGWSFRASDVVPVLLETAFKALIEFAYDLSKDKDIALDPTDLVSSGQAAVGDGFQIAVVPVMWPTLKKHTGNSGERGEQDVLISSSAGDISTAVQLVFSRY